MSDDVAEEEDAENKKPSKLPMIIGLVLALAGGGGGFFAVQSGMLGGGGESHSEASAEGDHEEDPNAEHIENISLPDVVFVEVPQITVSLGPKAQAKHLRFRASLEVPSNHATEVESVMPRVQDVMNSYLRALEPRDIEAPGALVKLRGQMLRRVRLVVGEGRVSDLLVLEFVLN